MRGKGIEECGCGCGLSLGFEGLCLELGENNSFPYRFDHRE